MLEGEKIRAVKGLKKSPIGDFSSFHSRLRQKKEQFIYHAGDLRTFSLVNPSVIRR